MKLTQERLKELLHYNPMTGVFTWLILRGRTAKSGQVAGTIKTDGYRRIVIDGKGYVASRLAWLYVEGYWPEHDIDHENRIRHDNKWKNLKHVSEQCNTRNRNILKNNKSGITGVYWNKINKIWMAQITIFYKIIYLGSFKSKIDAAQSRWNAEVKHGFPGCNSTSTAFLYLQSKGV